MIKRELIENIENKQQQLSGKEVKEAICQILEHMSKVLSRGECIEIRGFGSFSLKRYFLYNARNPQTGKKVVNRYKHRIYFKPGKEMRNRVNRAFFKKTPIIQKWR